MRKIVSLVILISASVACSVIPPVPQHDQYGIHADVNPPGFYGVNNETHAQTYRPFNDPVMKGGQALSAKDYASFQQWIESVKQIADQRCR